MAHWSWCSARTAPMRRMIASRVGKIPTTLVRRGGISFFNRPRGLSVPDLPPMRVGEPGEGQQVRGGMAEMLGGVDGADGMQVADDPTMLNPHLIGWEHPGPTSRDEPTGAG